MTKYIAAGTRQSWFGFKDANGFLTGETATAPANGSGQAMLRLLGIQTASPGLPESEDVNIEGDDDVIGTITFPPNETPAFVANYAEFNLTFDARAQETSVETKGGIELGVLQPADPGSPNGTLIVQGKSLDQDTGSIGTSNWNGMIFPFVVAQPLGRETFAGREAASNRIKFTANKGDKTPWGVTVASGSGDADFGTTSASIITFKSLHPLLMYRITGDGATDSYTLPKALGATDHLWVYNETAELSHGAGVTGTAASATLGFDSAPAAGNRVIVLFGYVP